MNEGAKDSIQPQHSFEVENLVGVDQSVIDYSTWAAAKVWGRNVGQPTTFRLLFCYYISDGNGKITDRAGEYDPDLDAIKIAVRSDSFNVFRANGLSEEATALLITAHETAHRWQFKRGDDPAPSNHLDPDQYESDRFEQEAWREALYVFKEAFPNASGGFKIGKRNYTVPEESKYKT